jgi:hypothetical protein
MNFSERLGDRLDGKQSVEASPKRDFSGTQKIQLRLPKLRSVLPLCFNVASLSLAGCSNGLFENNPVTDSTDPITATNANIEYLLDRIPEHEFRASYHQKYKNDPNFRNYAGATGPWQIMPYSAVDYGCGPIQYNIPWQRSCAGKILAGKAVELGYTTIINGQNIVIIDTVEKRKEVATRYNGNGWNGEPGRSEHSSQYGKNVGGDYSTTTSSNSQPSTTTTFDPRCQDPTESWTYRVNKFGCGN